MNEKKNVDDIGRESQHIPHYPTCTTNNPHNNYSFSWGVTSGDATRLPTGTHRLMEVPDYEALISGLGIAGEFPSKKPDQDLLIPHATLMLLILKTGMQPTIDSKVCVPLSALLPAQYFAIRRCWMNGVQSCVFDYYPVHLYLFGKLSSKLEAYDDFMRELGHQEDYIKLFDVFARRHAYHPGIPDLDACTDRLDYDMAGLFYAMGVKPNPFADRLNLEYLASSDIPRSDFWDRMKAVQLIRVPVIQEELRTSKTNRALSMMLKNRSSDSSPKERKEVE